MSGPSLVQLGVAFGNTGGAQAVTELSSYKKAANEANKATKTASKGAKDLGGNFENLAQKAISVKLALGAVGAALGALAGLGASIQIIREFGKEISAVETISGATGQQMKEMTAIAKELGRTTKFSAAEAAGGLRFLSQAGFKASESMKALPAVLDLATAGALGLAEAADITSNILSGFKAEAEDAAKFADILAKGAASSNTSVTQLGGAMSLVSPIAASLNLSMEETTAAIGALSDAGIQGSRAGTNLRGVLASLAGPSDEAAKTLRQYNLTVQDVNPEMQDLASVLQTLEERNISTADAIKIFGREAASGALILMDASNSIRTMTGELEGAEGAAKDMAATMKDNLNGDVLSLKSSLEGLVLSLGDAGLTAVLRGLVSGATEVVRAITMVVENADYLAVALGVLTITRLPQLIAGLSATVPLMGSVAISMTGASTAAGALAATLNLIPGVALFTGMTVALTGIYRGFKDSSAAAQEFSGAMKLLEGTQKDLTAATQTYYENMTQSNLDVMVAQTKSSKALIENALQAAEAELQAAGFWTRIWDDNYLFETQRMQNAADAIKELRTELIDAETKISAAEHAASNFNRTQETTKEVVTELSSSLRKSTEAVFEQIPALESMQEAYGINVEAAERLLKAQNDLAKMDASKSVDELLVATEAITEALDLGIDKSAFFRQGLEAIGEIDSFGEQARELENLAAYILTTSGGLREMSAETREVYQGLLLASEAGLKLDAQIQLGKASASELGAAIVGISPAFAPLINLANQLAAIMNGIISSLGGIASGLARLTPLGRAVSGSFAGISGALKGLASAGGSGGVSSVLTEIKGNLTGVWNEAKTGSSTVEDLTTILNKEFTPALESTGGGASSAAEDVESLREEIERLEFDVNPLAKYNAEVENLNKLRAAGLSAEAFDHALQDLQVELAATSPLISGINEGLEGVVDYVAGGFKDGFSGLLDIVKDTLRNIAAEFLKTNFVVPIQASISSAFATGGGGGIGGIAQAATGGGGGIGGLLSGFLGSGGIAGGAQAALGLGGFSSAGIFNIASNAATAVSAASAAGTAISGLGATLGAALPVIGIAAAAFSFFKSKTTDLDAGLRIAIDGLDDAIVKTFLIQEKTKFWGLSKKTIESEEYAEDEVAGPIQLAIDLIGENVRSLADVLGLASADLDSFKFEFDISTKGLSDTEIQTALEAKFTEFGDELAGVLMGSYTELLPDQNLIDQIDAQLEALKTDTRLGGRGEEAVYAKQALLETDRIAAETAIEITHLNETFEALKNEGEGSLELLTRMVTNLGSVNQAMNLFGNTLLEASVAGATIATNVIDAIGSLELFETQTANLFATMLTSVEQEGRLTTLAMEQLTGTFDELGIAIPGTHKDFMDLIDAQDLASESGREVYASLLGVAAAFTTVRGTAEDLRQSRLDEVNAAQQVMDNRVDETLADYSNAQTALQESFGAEKTRITAAYQEQIDAATASANAATLLANASVQSLTARVAISSSIVTMLEGALSSRLNLTAEAQQADLKKSMEFLGDALASNGTRDQEGLQSAISALADPSTDLYANSAEYQKDFNKSTNLMADLKDVQETQLTAEELSLQLAQDQLSQIAISSADQIEAIQEARDLELEALDNQLNALLGIDGTVLSLTEAISAFLSAEAASAPGTTSTGTNFADGTFGGDLNSIYNTSLGRDVDQGGLDFYGSQYVNGLSIDDIGADVAGSSEASLLREAQTDASSLAGQINGVYNEVLGRNVDGQGLEFWWNKLNEGLSFDTLRDELSTSAEALGTVAPGIPSFFGGGDTGTGSRSGGYDGRGGFLSMLHPNETVVDHESRGQREMVAVMQEMADKLYFLQKEVSEQNARERKWDTEGSPPIRESVT